MAHPYRTPSGPGGARAAPPGCHLLPSPPEGWCVHWRVPQLSERVGELADGDRKALHFQAGDVVADQVARDPRALARDVLVHLVVDEVELEQWRSAHAVDHHQDVTGQRQVGADRVEGCGGEFVRAGQRHPAAAWLAMDADAELDLRVADLERGLACPPHRARGERDAE